MAASSVPAGRREEIAALLGASRVDLKARDAWALVARLR
jgi:hypothetical protein